MHVQLMHYTLLITFLLDNIFFFFNSYLFIIPVYAPILCNYPRMLYSIFAFPANSYYSTTQCFKKNTMENKFPASLGKQIVQF